MSNTRALLISTVLAGIAMLMVYSYVSDKEAAIKKQFGEEVVVLVAKTKIDPMKDIQPYMLEAVPIPKKFLQPEYITVNERDALFIDATTVASAPILKGEQVVKTKLLFDVVTTGLSGHVTVGKRAVTIPVRDVTAVNRLIKPGNHVDVIAAMTVRAGTKQEIVVFNILQDAFLLATGDFIQSEIPREIKIDPVSLRPLVEDLRKRKGFGTVTLEVKPNEAQKLIWLMASGAELYLTLRNANDRRIIEATRPMKESDVVTGGARGL